MFASDLDRRCHVLCHLSRWERSDRSRTCFGGDPGEGKVAYRNSCSPSPQPSPHRGEGARSVRGKFENKPLPLLPPPPSRRHAKPAAPVAPPKYVASGYTSLTMN